MSGKRLNLINKRFGRWVVKEFAYIKKRNSYWKCVCDCGTKRIVMGGNLQSGTSKSCGCLVKEKIRLPKGEASFNEIFAQYRNNAKRKKLSFIITKGEFRKLLTTKCFYCGMPPLQVRNGHYNGLFIHNGVDRLNSSKGYKKGNCVPCCKTCNYMKRCLSPQKFLDHIKLIVKKWSI